MGANTNICVGVIGGSFLTIGKANGLAVSGNGINIKTGTYTITSVITTSATNLSLIGYGTTHGDLGTAPLITSSTNSVDLIGTAGNNGSANYTFFQNLSLSSTAATRGNGIRATNSNWLNVTIDLCTFDGFSNGINGEYNVAFTFLNLVINRSEFKNSTAAGILNTNGGMIENNYLHDIAGDAITNGVRPAPNGAAGDNGYFRLTNNIIVKSNRGITDTRSGIGDYYLLRGNTIADMTSDCIESGNAYSGSLFSLENNIIYGCGGWGINVPASTTAAWNFNNAYGNNSSGDRRNSFAAGQSVVALSANPFTSDSGSNRDFSLNNTAGGGAALRGTGYPGVFPGGTTTGFIDIGAVQHSAAGGATGQKSYPIVQ